ncbi:hypothetical protein Zm00014a_021052 [Zea mays]|uniref:Uncharacterized protein n=1 Tax=Zea mays TaxID=4577 RepID=A0A3L6E4M0_MAIZE|nr:hypothetical protein Zm00014a_021052 [Zea mays]
MAVSVTGRALAEISIVAGSVLVGELSLLSVLAVGQLVKSHMKFLKRASIHSHHVVTLFDLGRCDHILSYGKGTRLLSYDKAELMLSDHRLVTAV